MTPAGARRVSTAGASVPDVMTLLGRFFPPGVIVNVGAGNSALTHVDNLVVQMDHVVPEHPVRPFVVADAAAIPMADGAADGVLLKDVLEHIADPLGALRETYRATRDGGRLVVTVPRAIPRAVWSDVTHVRGFTRDALTGALEAARWLVVAGPHRVGGFPGAGRLNLTSHLLKIMRIPVIGHWFGTNWWVVAERHDGGVAGTSSLSRVETQ